MTTRFFRFGLPVLALLASTPSAHAEAVDITLITNANGQLEVKLRPSANFDGVVSSLVFTIRWDATSNAQLGAVQQSAPAATFLPLSKSGDAMEHGGGRYQAFVGFGVSAMRSIPTNWVAGQEYTIATIAVTGTAAFALTNDTWTASHNADYYLALGGVDETGGIYGGLNTGIVAGELVTGGMTVMPNPAEKATMISFELAQPHDLQLELLNSAGQVVWHEKRPKAVGSVKVPLDLSSFEKGVYLLRVHGLEQLLTQRVVSR
ncbi:MAG: T9SS type A sorting domain-containing protein [Flavobacteriales bacterium]|nr:T9SS type A sorting domain-containing protein [Flavobacteriales bacterium]MBP9080620.1 T9SS type A sorting domain-containing protein [Flavobacteriales bacterium]